MESKVYFIDFKASFKVPFLKKLEKLLNKAGISSVINKQDLTAVKLHFGELGNTAFIRPVYIRKIVDILKSFQAEPFITDANTLYAGSRSDSVNHLKTAIFHGFDFSVAGAPLIIADGLRGESEVKVEINQKRFKEVFIGSEIINADSLVSVAHFKGHELAGFGGTIKNLGMGCASRKGKLAQHSSLSPKIVQKKCIGCGRCEPNCKENAIFLKNKKANIDQTKCVGCGGCILFCVNNAIQIQWDQSFDVFMENMLEHTLGVLQNKKGKALFVNFLTNISPACDCMPGNDAPIVRNIGVLASTDPIAIDQASVDLVNQEPALADSCLKTNTKPGEDKFKGVYPNIDWQYQLDYAEKIGLGSKKYILEKL